jgi:signal transduction histidine kinase
MVAPTRRDADVTCRLLERSAVQCDACGGLGSLAAEMQGGVGAILLTDSALLDAAYGAFQKALSAQPAWSDVPIVLLTRDKEWSDQARRALAALTNVTLLDMPTSTRSLLSAVQAALRARRKQYQIRDQLVRQAHAEEALRQADQRKDEFLATLAHELRNPLAAIRTGLQVMVRTPGDADRRERVLGMLDRQSALLVRLIDDLLDVSRISTGKVVLNRERLDLRHVIDAAVELAQSGMEAARHEVRIELPSGPVWVNGDGSRLAQVISNLLHNAAKYTPDGGRIVVSLVRSGGEAVIEVKDNGLGLPPEMLPRVFDLFTQVNRTLDRAQGGLGIGLSLVRHITELHGGSVAAASDGPDRGSTFAVRLPVTAPEAAMAASREAPVDADDREQRQLKLLVVDDNADVADALSTLLQADGHRIETAYSGAAGLEAAHRFRPDVIFCDIGMPGLDGHEVAARLRSDPQYDDTLLVAVTGWGTDEHKRRTAAAGFDVHLIKPISPQAVEAVLRRRS